MRNSLAEPEIVVRDGKPVAVILSIDEYRELLEKVEDLEALRVLEEMRREPLEFRRLDDFLAEHSQDV
jgi:PHD/YefM family antitoxin component YafN of YafNO toxin-antitoxin module